MANNPLLRTLNYFNNNSELMGLFAYNEFSEDVEFIRKPIWDSSIENGKAIDDQDLIQMRYYISSIHNFEPSKVIVGESCFLASKRAAYHPIKRFIESEPWDKVPRIDTWLIKAVGCEDNIYTRQASSKFLIAAVNRLYKPGCKFDHMLILEGSQGLGKSTLVEMIANEWYLDTNFGNKDKDLIDSMRGAFIIEISELSGMDYKDVNWLKSFLSKKVDRVRLPYASRSKDFKRKSVFIGTYNPSGNNMYLRDDTGNRRFWPIECKKFVDIEFIKNNLKQLWAEAYYRFKENETYYIHDKEALEILANIHNERELESVTHKTIKDWIKLKNQVTMGEIIEDCLKIPMKGRVPKDLLGIQTTIGIIMKKLKWRKGNNEERHIYYNPENIDLPLKDWEE